MEQGEAKPLPSRLVSEGSIEVYSEYLTQVYDFVFRVVERYGDVVKVWMTENEINAPGFAMTIDPSQVFQSINSLSIVVKNPVM